VETLALCGTAWFFLWPVYTIWQKNRPRSYPPGHPPEELLS
jgi:hypothetical protein